MPYVLAGVTRDALVDYIGTRLRFLAVELLSCICAGLSDPVFDDVGLAGFKR